MHILNRVALIVFAIAVAGCGIRSNIKPGESLRLDSETAVLLLGITPAYKVVLLRGEVANNVWERPIVDTPEINMVPESGYIFVKVKPTIETNRLGVSMVIPESRRLFGPCQDSIAPIFTLKPGTINYVGDLQYTYSGGQLRYDYTVNEDRAKAFLRANYPNLEASMTSVPMTPMKVKSTFCNPGTLTVPIYLPRSRR
jgi:hypothetical protein